MSLEDSVDLVLHAFKNANPGDIFVQKAPAATIGDLAKAISELIQSKSKHKIIGTMHGEKWYESLVSREEMARVQELGGYYRIPPDGRDLNYAQYFSEGEVAVSDSDDYTSHNTKLLGIAEIKALLQKQDWMKNALK